MTKLFVLLLVCAPLVLPACSSRDGKSVANKAVEGKNNYHASGDSSKATKTPLADQIKEKKLNLSSSKTVGDVFDSYKYATKKEWLETITKSGIIYVDYICQLDAGSLSDAAKKDGIVQRSLYVKFSIRDNGEAYVALITVVDAFADRKTKTTNYQAEDVMLKIVKAIYDNKEIVF
jgi:hypothetical protein